jgi:hypothetical protein
MVHLWPNLCAGADSRRPFCLRLPWEIRCSRVSSVLRLQRLRLSFTFGVLSHLSNENQARP